MDNDNQKIEAITASRSYIEHTPNRTIQKLMDWASRIVAIRNDMAGFVVILKEEQAWKERVASGQLRVSRSWAAAIGGGILRGTSINWGR